LACRALQLAPTYLYPAGSRMGVANH